MDPTCYDSFFVVFLVMSNTKQKTLSEMIMLELEKCSMQRQKNLEQMLNNGIV